MDIWVLIRKTEFFDEDLQRYDSSLTSVEVEAFGYSQSAINAIRKWKPGLGTFETCEVLKDSGECCGMRYADVIVRIGEKKVLVSVSISVKKTELK